MSKTFKELAQEIQNLRALSDLDLLSVPISSRGGFAAAKADAQTTLAPLRQQYNDEATARIGIVFAPKAGLEEAARTSGAVTYTADTLYYTLANKLEPNTTYGASLNASRFEDLVALLSDFSREKKFPLRALTFVSDGPAVNDRDSLQTELRRVIERSNPEINRTIFLTEVLESAYNAGLCQDIVPVVVFGADRDILNQLTPLATKGVVDIRSASADGIREPVEFLHNAFVQLKKLNAPTASPVAQADEPVVIEQQPVTTTNKNKKNKKDTE